MSDKELEIIPPKHVLRAKQKDERSLSVPLHPRHGVAASTLTGFQAEMQSRAYGKIAMAIRAQTEALEAETARRKSALKLLRATHELEEVPDILALDRAERRGERAVKYASLTAKYGNIDDERNEREHQRKLDELRRERELEEANARVVEAKRGTFTAEQKLENEQRLKQLDLEIWQKRKETQNMDAEKLRLLLSREVEGLKTPQQKPQEGSLEELHRMRESLLKRAIESAAEGDAGQAEKYEQLVAELDELVIAALGGQGKK